jgi:hypothetical protein
LSDVACDVAGADVALNDALSFVAEVKARFKARPCARGHSGKPLRQSAQVAR